METTNTPSTGSQPSTTGGASVPVRMHYPWWKIALFASIVLIVSQVIAINIAKNQ